MRETLYFFILHTIKTHEDPWVYANYQNQPKHWNSAGVTVDALIISILMHFLCLHICGHASILFDRISVEQIICLLPMSCIPTVTCAAWLPSWIMRQNSKVRGVFFSTHASMGLYSAAKHRWVKHNAVTVVETLTFDSSSAAEIVSHSWCYIEKVMSELGTLCTLLLSF